MSNVGALMRDPNTFGSFFRGSSWDMWEAVCRAAFAEPMTSEQAAAFRIVANREPPPAAVSELVLPVGRGGGKDSIASFLIAVLAARFEPRGILRPGEKATVGCFACDRAQAKIVFDYCRGYFEEIPYLKQLVVENGPDWIELRNKVVIQVSTASFRSVRGRRFIAVVYDEIAFMLTGADYKLTDVELDAALSPSLNRTPGSMKIMISSVASRRGLLWERYRDFYGKNDPNVLVCKGSTRQFNPSYSQDLIDKDMARDPRRYGAEYFCDFLSDLDSFLPPALVQQATDVGIFSRPPTPLYDYVAATDAAGGRGACSFTLAIAHLNEDGITILDLVLEKQPPFDPLQVASEFAGVCRHYGVMHLVGDNFAGGFPPAAFSAAGSFTRRPSRTAPLFM